MELKVFSIVEESHKNPIPELVNNIRKVNVLKQIIKRNSKKLKTFCKNWPAEWCTINVDKKINNQKFRNYFFNSYFFNNQVNV